MEQVVFVMILVFVGLCMGSFAGASVWRLRARQLAEDKKAGEPIDEAEFKDLGPLAKVTFYSDRSRCLRCGHPLAWFDLVPLFSWLSLRGRCRYCRAPIGFHELFMEVGVAVVFAVSYFAWPSSLHTPLGAILFGLWLSAVVLLSILFSYDTKWYLLPDRVVFPLMATGVSISLLRLLTGPDTAGQLISLGGAVLVLSGLYYVLWLISKGEWIGFGDVKLGLALALLLGDWKLALIALFGANLIGTALVVPGMLAGKINRKAHVPFGPLLIAGTVLAMLFGDTVVAWYQAAVF